MARPCWQWFRCSDFWALQACCEHGNALSPTGDNCDSVLVGDNGFVMLDEADLTARRLPVRTKLWNSQCGCRVDVYIDKDRRIYWLSELCVEETKLD